MTAAEMIIGVNLGLQKINSNAFDDFLNEEILYYINKAGREYIRRQDAYLQEELKNMSRQDFIGSTEASYNLGALINTHTFGNTNITTPTGWDNAKKASLGDLSNTMFSYVYSQSQMSASGSWRANKLISPSQIDTYLKSQYNSPIFRKYPVSIVGSDLYIFFDEEGDVYDLTLMYVKEPDKLVESSPASGEVTTHELPSHTHDEIVDIAVGMMAEDLKSARPYEQNQGTVKGEEA